MHALVVERLQTTSGKPLVVDLTERLIDNIGQGKAVVVANKPGVMFAAVRKQWLKTERKTRVERAQTLNASRISELTSRLADMGQTSFTARPPDDLLEADITFATADDFVRMAPDCKTMFVTYDFPKVKLHIMTSWMPQGGLVVIYGQD